MSKPIDEYSYRCGVMDCFAEMVNAGFKPIAFAHPFKTRQLRDEYIDHVNQLCAKYDIHYVLEDDFLITDLFAKSANQDTFNILFYKDETNYQSYLGLKKHKAEVVDTGRYDNYRKDIAYQFGLLLGYPKDACLRYINTNNDKE